jgi:hypothetical protein
MEHQEEMLLGIKEEDIDAAGESRGGNEARVKGKPSLMRKIGCVWQRVG